jgi:hypothetical protein
MTSTAVPIRHDSAILPAALLSFSAPPLVGGVVGTLEAWLIGS